MLDKKFISLPKDVLKTGEIVEKKSRFLAFAKNVETSEEAEEFYRSIKKEHKTMLFFYFINSHAISATSPTSATNLKNVPTFFRKEVGGLPTILPVVPLT